MGKTEIALRENKKAFLTLQKAKRDAGKGGKRERASMSSGVNPADPKKRAAQDKARARRKSPLEESSMGSTEKKGGKRGTSDLRGRGYR